MDLNAIKQKRVQDFKAVREGKLKLSPTVKAICRKYGKDPDKFFPQQVLTLLRYTDEQVELIMRLLTDPDFIAPQAGSQEIFLNTSADIVLYGGAAGSGKTNALLMDALKFIDDPNFRAVYFRKNTTQLDGGLWPDAKKLFSRFGGVAREQAHEINFPSGATIKFTYMELENMLNHIKVSSIQLSIGIDKLVPRICEGTLKTSLISGKSYLGQSEAKP